MTKSRLKIIGDIITNALAQLITNIDRNIDRNIAKDMINLSFNKSNFIFFEYYILP